jgi:pimeloyl-ACP methyl ester carboxylesterase
VGPLAVWAAGPSSGRPLVLVHSVNAAASAYEVRPVYEHAQADRPTYAFDLPGYGGSARTDRPYSIRLMVDAVLAVVAEVRRRHPAAQVDAMGLSLGCEFVARAAVERPDDFRSLALVSPTGFASNRKGDGAPGTDRGVPGLLGFLRVPLWDDALFDGLTRPRVIRFFLEKTFGSKVIDEGLFDHCVATTRVPGAKWAPLAFLSGRLFSADTDRMYDQLTCPVWVAHGTKGDFVDYRRLGPVASRKGWTVSVLPTGALPWFEVPERFFAAFAAFAAFQAGLGD